MRMMSQFAPWILFATLSDVDWRLALVVGLVVQAGLILAAKPLRIGVLDGAMVVYFAVVGAVALVSPNSPIKDHVDVISSAWLALVAAGSAVVGHPFTIDFSRDSVSPEFARSPRFIAVNKTITEVWAAAFAGMALAGVLGEVLDAPRLNTIGNVLLLVAALKFTKSYPQRAREKAAAQRAAGATQHA